MGGRGQNFRARVGAVVTSGAAALGRAACMREREESALGDGP